MSRPDVSVRARPARASTAVLERSLAGFRGDLTVADAAARGGLALRDAESGLRDLAHRRGGHLKATDKGELVYSFPDGLVRVDGDGWGRRLLRGGARALASAARFVVRAWVSVVMIGYAVLFLVVLLALAARDDDGDGIGGALAMVGRVLFEALYWTFHPFSPVALAIGSPWASPGGRRREHRLPFYERVNRFVFGPPRPPEDPRARERRLVGEIRRLDGRAGPEDVMRLTGLDREAAERELLRLVVDYDGDIQVADNGAIVYAFPALRSTVASAADAASAAPAVWSERVSVPPLTGNRAFTNVLLGGINAFNLAASGAAVACGLTLDRLSEIVARLGADAATAAELPPLAPAHGVPLLLGWVPFLFSAGLFVMPAARALRRRRERARVAAENGRRGLLRLLLADPDRPVDITPAQAERAWSAAAAQADARAPRPRRHQIEATVRALGGEIELSEGGAIVYRFDTGARERQALAQARAGAAPSEALPGRVVFASSEPGSGDLEGS